MPQPLPRPRPLLHGVIAGLMGGTVIALWFLLVDIAAGAALSTPQRLADALFGPSFEPSGLVVPYTFLHFAVFAAIGVLLAELVVRAGLSPGLVMGALFGVAGLTAVHYSALLMTGADVLALLSPVHVLGSNLAAGVVMGVWLHHAFRPDAPIGLAALREHPRLERGVITGLIGAVAVAAWFLVVDVLRGQPLFTPGALGSLVFLGADSAEAVRTGFGVVAAYTALHLLVFAAVGVALETAVDGLERAPGFWLVGFIGFLVLEAVFLTVSAGLGIWVLGAIGWWQIAAANLLAVATMFAWAWRSHPTLRRTLATGAVHTRL